MDLNEVSAVTFNGGLGNKALPLVIDGQSDLCFATKIAINCVNTDSFSSINTIALKENPVRRIQPTKAEIQEFEVRIDNTVGALLVDRSGNLIYSQIYKHHGVYDSSLTNIYECGVRRSEGDSRTMILDKERFPVETFWPVIKTELYGKW